MELKEFERIKKLIKEAELKSAKSQGVIDSILKGWEEKYGFNTVEDAEKKLAELMEEKKNSDARLEKLMNDLEKSYDWDKLEEELNL